MSSLHDSIELASAEAKGAARRIARAPTAALLSACILGFGVGLAALVYAGVQAVLLRPLPFHEPDQLAVIWATRSRSHDNAVGISPLSFRRVAAAASRDLESCALERNSEPTLVTPMGGFRLKAERVSGGYFDLLGVAPLRGRYVGNGDDRPGAPDVAVVSLRFWKEHLGGRQAAVGTTIDLDGKPYHIIGVMPASFDFPAGTDLWTPLFSDAGEANNSTSEDGLMLARLRRGVGLASLQRDLNSFSQQVDLGPPGLPEATGLRVVSLRSELSGDVLPVVWLESGIASVFILIACANLGVLWLMRQLDVESEACVRLALGARAIHLIAAQGAEYLLIAALSLPLAFLVAWGGMPALSPLLSGPEFGFTSHLGLGHLLGFALAATLAICAAAAAAPTVRALRLSRRRSAVARTPPHIFRWPLALEFGLAFLLVGAAGLMLTSLARLEGTSAGFDPSGIEVVSVCLPLPSSKAASALGRRWQSLRRALLAKPAVASIALSSELPLAGIGFTVFTAALESSGSHGARVNAKAERISPGYFAVLGVGLDEGRDFSESDAPPGTPVAIVSRDFLPARQAAVGGWLQGSHAELPSPAQVIAVAPDVRDYRQTFAPRPTVYLPIAQSPTPNGCAYVLARARSGSTIGPRLAAGIHEWDSAAAVGTYTTVVAARDRSIAGQRTLGMLLTLVGLAALGLASLAIYSAVSYSCRVRRRELAIRRALGARTVHLAAQALGPYLIHLTVGCALGALTLVLLNRVLSAFVYGASGRAATLATIAALVVAAIAACMRPRLEVARSNPSSVLRTD